MIFFLELSFVLFTYSDYSQKFHSFLLFLKMSVLLNHLHLHQVFTILSLPSIHQPTMNNQFDAPNAPKFNFYSSYLITYAHKLHLFHCLSIFIKKNQDFDSKLCHVQTHDYLSLTSGSVSW